jgi:GT2 family glycosyltransferase
MNHPTKISELKSNNVIIPDISVIIPVKNLNDINLADCLESLRKQDFHGCFEVITVGGGTIAQARNEGIKIANSDFIAFIDSDCIATENWVKRMHYYITFFHEAGGIGGISISPSNQDKLSRSIDAVYRSYIGSLGSTSLNNTKKTQIVKSLSTGNCIFRKNVLSKVNGFDERFLLNEDTDLSARLRENQYSLIQVPDSIVFHKRKKSFLDFARKFYRWGVSRSRSMLTDRRLIDYKVLSLLFLSLFNVFISLYNIQISIFILATYLLIIFFSSINTIFKHNRLLLIPTILLLYFIQHFSYLIGLFNGLIKGKYKPIIKNTQFEVLREVHTN